VLAKNEKSGYLIEAHALLLHDFEVSAIVRSHSAMRMLSPIDCDGANVLLEAGLGPILTMWWCCG
jgi:hypothetical protein